MIGNMNKNTKEIVSYPTIHGITLTDSGSPSSFPSHWHNAAEFAVIRKDHCRYRIGDTEYDLMCNDILMIWPRELHEIIRVPKDGSVFVQFSSDILENNLDLVAATRFLTGCHVISSAREPELAQKINGIFERIREIYHSRQSFSETRCKQCIYEILLLVGDYVMREKKEEIGSERFSDTSWEYIRRACSYIAEHAAEDISQSEVAGKTGLSPYYFSKLFKEYTQMTFPAYLARIRVQSATTLLSDRHLSITECAFNAGFQSTTTFNKLFREITGYSPREFRKLHRHNY